MEKLWGGAFSKTNPPQVNAFNSSFSFDQRLWEEDLLGSKAHLKALKQASIINANEYQQINDALEELQQEFSTKGLNYQELPEDIHSYIEAKLIAKIGPLGGKLHTGRSRNDQVALDMHLYVKKTIKNCQQLIKNLQLALLEKARQHQKTIMPGYTHLQRAQPVLLAHHLLAYFWMLQRDVERFADNYKRADLNPLGAGALAGSGFPLDRDEVAKSLGFQNNYPNSMDAVSDRDFIIEFLSNSSILIMHLSRLSEEIIFWCSGEADFATIDDAYSTGSSLMPQKKNPDLAELIRGKSGRIYGNLMALLTVLKGLPLTYNKDMQEDKEALFDTVDNLYQILPISFELIKSLVFKEENLWQAANKGFTWSTDLADLLVKKGVPFRTAHHQVGKALTYWLENNLDQKTNPPAELTEMLAPLKSSEIQAALSIVQSIKNKEIAGGTSFAQVEKQLAAATKILES